MSGIDPAKYNDAPQALSRSPVEPVQPKPAATVRPSGLLREVVPVHLAKPGCRKCFGRGWTARCENGTVVPCPCVLKATSRLIAKTAAQAANKEKKHE